MPNITSRRLIEPQSIFKATATNRIAYKVRDYARTRDFYIDLLGMECVYDDGNKCAVTFGSPPRSLYILEEQENDDTPYVDHIAFSIPDFDLEATESELKKWGFEPESSSEHACTIWDPDGYKLQICAEEGFHGTATPRATTEGKARNGETITPPSTLQATAVNHVAYQVPDYARTRDFFVDLLGMRVAFDDGQKCSVAFGNPEDAIYIVPSKDSDRSKVDHLAFSVSDFQLDEVEAELRKQGHTPEDDGDYAWTIWDPNGYKIQICAEQGVYPGARHDPHHNPR